MSKPTLVAWRQRLFAPVDGASLAVFRIVFGAFVAIDAWRYLAYGWVRAYYIEPQIHFTYFGFDFVRPWPGDWMIVHFAVMSGVALLVAAGLFYRVSAPLLALLYGYVFLLEASVYMNHHYLMALLALLLACLPAHHALSIDRRRGVVARESVLFGAVVLVRFQLAIVYLYGALAKLNVDWLGGEPMYSTLVRRADEVPALAHLVPPALLASAIAWAGVVVDLAIPVLLLRRRTVWWGIALATVFHLVNGFALRIGVFSWLMVGALLIFLPPDWPRRLAGVGVAGALGPGTRRPLVATLAAVYAVLQLALPLRHWLYPGDVNWSEEGHRFAWRMKLRSKHSTMAIRATDPATGRSWRIDPEQDLIPRQIAKLHTFPDILLQYVHWHRDRLREQGVAAPIIQVDWRCSLNGAPPQRLVDPDANLAIAPRTLWPAAWILPYDRRRSAAESS